MEWKILEPGDVFEERYRIQSVLGVGGFAHVYRAVQDGIDREVAIKVLRPLQGPAGQADEKAAELERWIKRFKREAKVISNLRDPHTITMYDFGLTDSGMSYMVFEFISGDSLDKLIGSSAPLSPERAVSILRQCLSSIQEAHAMGILHRDLKPANIMIYDHLGRQDQVKVLDFGIAKSMFEDKEATTADLTQEGKIIGTPRYMSPEQLMVEDMGPASDIYSLGLVIFEVLYGKKAIAGNSTMKIISQQVTPEPIEVPQNSHVPAGLRKIVERMLAKHPDQRFSTAQEVMDALEYWEDDDPSPEQFGEEPPTIQMDSIEALDDDDSGAERDALESLGAEERNENLAVDRSKKSGPNYIMWAGLIGGVAVVGVLLILVLAQDDASPAEEAVEEDGTTHDFAGQLVEDESEAASAMTEVVTEPSGAVILIDDSLIGTSPIEFDAGDVTYPLTVHASLDDGREMEKQVDSAREFVELVFEEQPVAEHASDGSDEQGSREESPDPSPPPREVEPAQEPEPSPPPRQVEPAEEPDPEPDPPEEDSPQDSFDSFIPLD